MTTQTRYDLKALFLLVLLGGATAADAQVQPQLAHVQPAPAGQYRKERSDLR